MNKPLQRILLPFIMLFVSFSIHAQAPEKFSYQGVVRNSSNALVTNTAIGIRISILQGGATGNSVYSETQNPTTNDNGLFSIEVGAGTVVSGTFSGIDWSSSTYFLKTEIDPAGGSNYSISGTTQLLSVPYALHAKTADSVVNGFSGDYNDLTNKPSDVSEFNNDAGYISDYQNLSVSATGDTLYISKGNWVIVPGISNANNGNGNTIQDGDGNSYGYVVIGSQTWFSSNLKTTKYANGDPIPNVTNNSQWSNLTSGAWAHYSNNSQYDNQFGKLYNWYAVNDSRNVCPTGWHVPSDSDWTVLETHLGGQPVAGGKLKSTQVPLDWSTPNTGATNSEGFNAQGGGYRLVDGSFDYIKSHGYWWSSTSYSTTDAWRRSFMYNSSGSIRNALDKNMGFSIRCVKD